MHAFNEIVECVSHLLTHLPPSRPLLLQTSSCDIIRSARDSRRTAALAVEAAARAAKTAAQQARREAAILAGGGTSAPGGGGGGGVSGSTDDAVRQVGAVGAGAAGSPLVFPALMARQTRPRGRAPRSLDDRDRRRAVSATRRSQRYIIQWVHRGAPGVPIVQVSNYRGRLREARPPNALIGPRIDSDDNGSTCQGKVARAGAGGWPVVLIIRFSLSCPLTRKEPRLTRGKDAKPALTRTVCAEPFCRLPAPLKKSSSPLFLPPRTYVASRVIVPPNHIRFVVI